MAIAWHKKANVKKRGFCFIRIKKHDKALIRYKTIGIFCFLSGIMKISSHDANSGERRVISVRLLPQ